MLKVAGQYVVEILSSKGKPYKDMIIMTNKESTAILLFGSEKEAGKAAKKAKPFRQFRVVPVDVNLYIDELGNFEPCLNHILQGN